MGEYEAVIESLEKQLGEVENELESSGELEAAYARYQDIEMELLGLDLIPGEEDFSFSKGVLATCLNLQASVLNRLGRPDEAEALRSKEVETARNAGYDVTFALNLLLNAANDLFNNEVERGMLFLEEAWLLLDGGQSAQHQNALGKYWTIYARSVNQGILEGTQDDALNAADTALNYLLPTENWEDAAHAYGIRAGIFEALGDYDAATADRNEQSRIKRR